MLFANKQINITKNKAVLFDSFVQDEANKIAAQQILDNQKILMDKWQIKSRIDDVLQQHVAIPNGTVGKPYKARFDTAQMGWDDVNIVAITGLETVGLSYDAESFIIQGTPTASGDIKCNLLFRLMNNAEQETPNEKPLTLIINPNPKTLWKNIPSNPEELFAKPDEMAAMDTLGSRQFVAASLRGRSHGNVGSFRDDDFAYKYFAPTGFSLVVVADGAGSARLAREGSAVACNAVVTYFTNNFLAAEDQEFEALLTQPSTEETQKKISQFVYNHLSKAAYYAHQQLVNAAVKAEAELKDFNTTLIFTLFKKYDAGYAFLSFGVGDCPIALLNKDMTEVKLMNWLDVGEFGGGTRFVTMPEIFKSDKLSTRFGYKLMDDFSYLFMMTDGIYDAKFVVEANLEKVEKWKEFLEDLQGKNEDNISVQFTSDNKEIASQLSSWMQFWSAGNHDDRTLAIVF